MISLYANVPSIPPILNRFLMGDHKRAIEVYLEAERRSKDPDWEIHYYLGIIKI